jgi:DNA-binding transcriptional LysR family regulator
VRMRLYASPSYLEKHGTPQTLADMADHRLICQSLNSIQVSAGATLVQHLLTQDIPNLFTVNNYFGVLQGIVNNIGIGVMPDYLTEDFGDLVRVLPDLESGEVPVFLAYPEELRQSKRISAFRDFVQEEIFAHRRKIRESNAS